MALGKKTPLLLVILGLELLLCGAAISGAIAALIALEIDDYMERREDNAN